MQPEVSHNQPQRIPVKPLIWLLMRIGPENDPVAVLVEEARNVFSEEAK